MKTKKLIPILALVLAIMACNLPAGQGGEVLTETVTATALLPTQALATTEVPSQTALPSATPLPTLTPTPLIPIAWPSDKGVNCRFGPSTDWLTVGALLVGQTATIQGRNADYSWWYVVTPNDPGRPCWVAASVTNYAGNVSGLPVVAPPDASVTKVSIKADPNSVSVAGCIGPLLPIKLKGTIAVNGPTTVKWYFETEQGGAMSTQTTHFDAADEKTESTDYTPVLLPGTYWVRLVVLEPNDKTAEAKYKVECP